MTNFKDCGGNPKESTELTHPGSKNKPECVSKSSHPSISIKDMYFGKGSFINYSEGANISFKRAEALIFSSTEFILWASSSKLFLIALPLSLLKRHSLRSLIEDATGGSELRI